MNLARLGNKYLADEEPWKTIKTDEERTKTVMYVALQIAAALASLSEPFLPHTSAKLKKILNLPNHFNLFLRSEEGFKEIEEGHRVSKTETEASLVANHKINKSELLFSKIEREDTESPFLVLT